MPPAPFLVFDKSTLQCLNPDEAVWLDHFFQTNITPLFFIETLADLRKEMKKKRCTAEQLVATLAFKTPDLRSSVNVYHGQLMLAELVGSGPVPMNGKTVIGRGQNVTMGNQTGMIFHQSPQEEALHRWHAGEFLEAERIAAKYWRNLKSSFDFETKYRNFQRLFLSQKKPRTLAEAKALTDGLMTGDDQREILRYGLQMLTESGSLPIARSWQKRILSRWDATCASLIRDFAPYFAHVFSVDLFFYLGMAADLIARNRPSHWVDIAYLYYLPFCQIFTSNDNLHVDVAPLFLRSDQSFVKGTDLKSDLGSLDAHYSSLPENVKDRGMFNFAPYPPDDDKFLTTRLWSKHAPCWRIRRAEEEARDPLPKQLKDELRELTTRLRNNSMPGQPVSPVGVADLSYAIMRRTIVSRKGKWRRLPAAAG